MTAAEFNALQARKPAAKGKTSPTAPKLPSPAQTAKETAARAEAVAVGLLALINTTFGVPVYLRKYRLLDASHAAQLDELFYQLTNTQP